MSPDSSIGPFEIKSLLGKGGMGEVWLARDTRLDRRVALKVLPDQFNSCKESLARFEREAKLLASLDHPNIGAIHGFEHFGDTRFLVLQLVEGETLTERLARGPMPVRTALEVCRQIAEAIAAAHAKGIVHRDLKPANVKLTATDTVKVLDFGIAKALEEDLSSAKAPDDSTPTVLGAVTRAGALVGTPAYMSPEQASGEAVDRRSDIWSFGCLLYECLTGIQPFKSKTAVDSLHAVLHKELEWTAMPTHTPVRVQTLLRKCLTREPGQRLQDIRHAAAELKAALAELSGSSTARGTLAAPVQSAPRSSSPGRSRVWAYAIGVLVLVSAAAVWWTMFQRGRIADPGVGTKPIDSLAVLPFANFSGDTNKEYIADGLTDELSSKLRELPALKVTPRTTVMAYKGMRKSISELAHDLRVDALVEGSVKLSGRQVNVTVSLIEAAHGRELFSRLYEGDIGDIVKLESQIALTIADGIKVLLTPEAKARLGQVRQVNPQAYDAYQLGRFYYKGSTATNNLRAIASLERAVALDPSFAAAHAALAGAYVEQFYYYAPQDEQWDAKASLELQRALDLDKNLAEVYLARAKLLWSPRHVFRHEEAMADLQHALKLNPDLAEIYYWQGLIYGHTGFFEEAVRAMQRSITLDPLDTALLTDLASIYLWRAGPEDYERAQALWAKVPSGMYPSFTGAHSAWTFFALQRTNEAMAVLESSLKVAPDDDTGELGAMKALLLAAQGDTAKAEQLIEKVLAKETRYGEFHHTAYMIGCTYARLGKPHEAMALLKKAADTGFPCYRLFQTDPNLDSLRKESEFTQFMVEQRTLWETRKAVWFGPGAGRTRAGNHESDELHE